MDMDFPVDVEEISRIIDGTEVMTVFMPMLRKTLLLDLRCTSETPPFIRVVAMARGPEERIRFLRRVRPSFPRPENITIIPWPKFVDSIVRLGVFDRILQRVAATGYPSAVQECHQALQELRQLERAELAAVIRGENYHTVWARGQ